MTQELLGGPLDGVEVDADEESLALFACYYSSAVNQERYALYTTRDCGHLHFTGKIFIYSQDSLVELTDSR